MKYLLLLAALLSFSSCEDAILGPEPVNSAKEVHQIFWDDLDRHYGLFNARGWDWDSVYTATAPLVTESTTEDELWDILTGMIAYLDDSHTSISDPVRRRGFVSGSERDDETELAFDLDLVVDQYLDSAKSLSDDFDWRYGSVKDHDIGYVYFNALDLGTDPGQIDLVLDELGSHKAIIIDLRNNLGGDDQFAERIAGAFADDEELIYTVEERNGPEHGDFGEKLSYYSKPIGDQSFTKPVVVLTDRITVSAAEIFLLHLKSFDHVTQIGDSTAGDFSDVGMTRFLPNGWFYSYSIMQFLQPDGTSLDGIGHVPDIFVKGTEQDIASGKDVVLERALDFIESLD